MVNSLPLASSPTRLRLLDQKFAEWVLENFSSHLSSKVDKHALRCVAEAVSYANYLKHGCLDLLLAPQLPYPLLHHLLKKIDPDTVKRCLPPEVVPIVCSEDGTKIWLRKYYDFEKSVAQDLRDLQSEGRIEIITGGPGTGKTWTAAQRIQTALTENPNAQIALAAPTGKAANNMKVALVKSGLDMEKHHLKSLTLHSLLGLNGRSPKPRFHKNNPLGYDYLLVDEASMIDLPMMHRLLQAIPSHAHLLLLGDKDQLASVEAGSVLHDICDIRAFSTVVTTLTKNWRSEESPEIGLLANALNQGMVPEMAGNQTVRCHLLKTENAWSPPWLDFAVEAFRRVNGERATRTIENILHTQTAFQILCALREGPQGVTGINAMMAKALGHPVDEWYEGRPIMITQNDHDRKLYNGDVGMLLNVDGQLNACFYVEGRVKVITRAQIPSHETCYAITVHKSQGSEYKHIMVILPAEPKDLSPVLTRELVYTAVTRARDSIDLWCGDNVLAMAATRTLQRMSGLGEMLC